MGDGISKMKNIIPLPPEQDLLKDISPVFLKYIKDFMTKKRKKKKGNRHR